MLFGHMIFGGRKTDSFQTNTSLASELNVAGHTPRASKAHKIGLALPRGLGTAETLSVSDSPISDPRDENPLNILVAEDNYANQLVAKTLLGRAGHHITTVNNGHEAIQACRLAAFDLILMDIEMPELNGIEATEHIRSNTGPNQKTQIIALTAYGSASEKYTYRHSGIDEVLTKPFKVQDLNTILIRTRHPLIHAQDIASPPVAEQTANLQLNELTKLPFLDPVTLDTLITAAGATRMRNLSKSYWRSAYVLLSDMQNAQQIWDRDSLQRSAHALKGASANIGLLQVGRISAALQNARPDTTSPYLDALEFSMASSRKALAQYIQKTAKA